MNSIFKTYVRYVSGVKPNFLKKYILTPEMQRLENVSYFCGMPFNNSGYYNFVFYISRLDHSISVATKTYRLCNDKKAALAGLFHDISTPCFSHVIDYYHDDFIKQESTEEKTKEIIMNSEQINSLLNEDGIMVEEVYDAKLYPFVDNERPKVSVDRLDGTLLSNICWTKKSYVMEAEDLVHGLKIVKNEDNEDELIFANKNKAIRIQNLEKELNDATHNPKDFYAMNLLASIVKRLIKLGLITEEDLYVYSEEAIMLIIRNNVLNDKELMDLWIEFNELDVSDKNIMVTTKNKVIAPLYYEGKHIKRLSI